MYFYAINIKNKQIYKVPETENKLINKNDFIIYTFCTRILRINVVIKNTFFVWITGLVVFVNYIIYIVGIPATKDTNFASLVGISGARIWSNIQLAPLSIRRVDILCLNCTDVRERFSAPGKKYLIYVCMSGIVPHYV